LTSRPTPQSNWLRILKRCGKVNAAYRWTWSALKHLCGPVPGQLSLLTRTKGRSTSLPSGMEVIGDNLATSQIEVCDL
jgi:hypothetical protein